MNIFGGKITTYRRLAEAALEKIERQIGARGRPWTGKAALPGGDFGVDEVAKRVEALCNRYPFLERGHARRLIRLYGTRAGSLLGEAQSPAELGRHFGADLYAAEVHYLMRLEWARNAQDVLWRRTKLGLRLDAGQAAALDAYMRGATEAFEETDGSGRNGT